MEKLLYLVHRIPYPPNKGDKIRSFNFLKLLAEQYEVFLGAFVDDPNDWQYIGELDKYCSEIKLIELQPAKAKLRSLQGFLSGKALTLPYYTSAEMQRWVIDTIERHNIDKVLIFSAAMAQFVEAEQFSKCMRVVDFVDIDSDKWRQYALSKRWPMSWVYQRESRTLFNYECEISQLFDRTLFVSQDEAASFKKMSPSTSDKIDYINNGVDSDYFSPKHNLENPYVESGQSIVFTGAMDYWANEDAVVWFAVEILPQIQWQYPDVIFYIVGSHPTDAVLALASQKGVVVTGRVEDIRPYIQHATVVVAPMRIARGVQNKVLEAMAMAVPVITTTAGREGIHCEVGTELLEADSVEDFERAVISVLVGDASKSLGEKARIRVCDEYSWRESSAALTKALDNDRQ